MKKKLLFIALFACTTTASHLSAQSRQAAAPKMARQTSSASQPRTASDYVSPFASTGKVIHLTPAQAETGGAATIYANMVGGPATGYHSFPATPSPVFSPLSTGEQFVGGGGAVIKDGKFYGIVPNYESSGITSSTLYVYKVDGWQLVDQRTFTFDSQPGLITFQMALDNNTGTIYTLSYSDNGQYFVVGTLDLSTYQRKTIGESGYLYALAVDVDGTLYGINSDADLVRINTENGEQTVIGNTGVSVDYYMQSGTIDPQSGTFYWAPYGENVPLGLYTVDKATGRATRFSSFTEGQELAAMTIAGETASEDAPGRADGIRIDFRNGSLNGAVSFTAPVKTYGGGTLMGELTAVVLVDGEEVKSLGLAAGETVSTPVEVATEGYHSVAVYFQNEAGRGPRTAASYYFGIDVPGAVVEPTLAKDKDTALLTWDAPEASLHGGYFDPARTNYTIVRHQDGQDATVATHITATEFSETITTQDISTVYYTIIAYSDQQEGGSAESNKQCFGDAFSVPVEWQLDQEDEFSLFTVIDANGDGFSWEPGTWRYTQNKTTYAQNMWNDDDKTDADDWFITPAVRLKPGHQYYFQFSAANTMETKKESFEVKLGRGTAIADLTTTILEKTTIGPSDDWYHIRPSFNVGEEGNYHLAIHCMSKAPDYYRLYIDSLYVTEGPALDAPSAVTDLTITPAELGALKATLQFTLPTLTASKQSQLTNISKVEIFRKLSDTDEQLMATLTDELMPGSSKTIDDPEPRNGYNTYRIVAYNASGVGEDTEATAYVGMDAPTYVDHIDTDITEDHAVLSWPKVGTTGQHGGYVNPDEVTFDVYDGIQFKFVIRGLNAHSFDTGDPSVGVPHSQFWLVTPSNEWGRGYSFDSENKVISSERYIAGETYPMPFIEEYPNGQLDNRYWFRGDYNVMVSTAWRIGVDETTNGIMQFYGGVGGWSEMYPAAIDLRGAENPVFMFDYYKTIGGGRDSLEVIVSPYGLQRSFETVLKVSGSTENTTYTVDLSKYKNLPRVLIGFRPTIATANCRHNFDNLRVINQYESNLSLLKTEAPAEVRYDRQADIKATVANFGKAEARDYSVCLYKDGRTLIQRAEGQALKTGETAQYVLHYTPTLSDPDQVVLHVEIEYEEDELPDDDASERLSLRVIKPEIPHVTDLAGLATADGLQLSWSRPANLDGTQAREVIEDVEQYTDFIIDNIGDWTVYDADHATNYFIGGTGIPTYPNMGGPAAFYVFNPFTLGIGSYFEPHSGQKFFAAFAPQPDATGTTVAANDWLVSPELSGEAQTISFWVENFTLNLAEDFTVYYSTTDNQLSTWTTGKAVKLGDRKGTDDWSQVSFELPAGAKYFAINYHSKAGNGLLIDDIAFTAAAKKSEINFMGYNVYHDGQKMNDSPLPVTTYTVSPLQDGSYTVTVQYKEVESAPSNEVVVSGGIVTAIHTPATAAAESQAPIYDLQGRRMRQAPRRQLFIMGNKKYVKQ